ncbi:MAG: hypothetical protein QXF23_04115 [Candidatus Bathyarchaeia archaeon]
MKNINLPFTLSSQISKHDAGSTVTYMIILSNPTLTDLSGVTLVDYLPARVSYISSSPAGVYNSDTHTIT